MKQATFTIADLPGKNLALTLGTPVTLDVDGAGHGWFIDPTPLTNDEFASGSHHW